MRHKDVRSASTHLIDPLEPLTSVQPQIQAEDSGPLELHDSEITAATKILAHLHFKYSDRPTTHGNLMSLKEEAEAMFSKIGLEVVVDWTLSQLTNSPPEITVVGRLTPFEIGRQYSDVKKGVADSYWDLKRKEQESKRKRKK